MNRLILAFSDLPFGTLKSYGVCEMERWLKLQTSGLIWPEGGESRAEVRYAPIDYPLMSKRYKLAVPEVDEIRRSDIAYAYSGRASLLVRYIEEGLKRGWGDFTKIECENTEVSEIGANSSLANIGAAKPFVPNNKTVVFAVGGLTRSEISSIQLLSQDIGIISTAVVNSRSLLDSFHTS